MNKVDTSHIKNWPEDVVLGSSELAEPTSLKVLSALELDEFDTFKNPKRKTEFLTARKLFRFLVSEMDLDENGVQLLKEKGGKPYAEFSGKRLHVSFSHSNEKVFCAISKELDIGLDIEPVTREINAPVLNRILNEQEAKSLDLTNPIQLWTLKEAAVKCLGTGLRTNLRDLTLVKKEKGGHFIRFNNDKLIEICSFRQSDHQIALAYQSNHI
ncbi:MAG: 4'-phosphopantetheinyl transferase superfamily protein [Gracilimonas sp.]